MLDALGKLTDGASKKKLFPTNIGSRLEHLGYKVSLELVIIRLP